MGGNPGCVWSLPIGLPRAAQVTRQHIKCLRQISCKAPLRAAFIAGRLWPDSDAYLTTGGAIRVRLSLWYVVYFLAVTRTVRH